MTSLGRRLLFKLRSHLQRRFPAGTLRRRSPPSLPPPSEPDPDRLLAFPGEGDLPEEIRDDRIVCRAVERRRRAGDSPGPAPAPAALHQTRPLATHHNRPITNVVFVSHCDFAGNSAYHVHAIASELQRRGLCPAIAIPGGAYTVEEVGPPPFPVLTYRQVRRGKLRFPDGQGPDLVHAFTPRERVRRLTVDLVREYECPYLVHLEDNEEVLLSSALGGVDTEWLRSLPAPLLDGVVEQWQSHPRMAPQFIEHAAGVTVIIDRLLEFVPAHVPTQVIRAGFDEGMLSSGHARDAVRASLGIAPDDFAVLYPGHVHAANVGELRGLWQAIATLRSRGLNAVLVKTGWSAVEVADFPALGQGLRDLGWVQRSQVPELLSASDALVQPGKPGPFNDYRLPSKLPEFFASARPVVLPRTNVGLLVEDGVEALLLERGDADEIVDAIRRLAADPALGRRLGEHGRAFAVRELRWDRVVDGVQELYETVSRAGRPPVPAWSIGSPDPPVRLVAIVDRPPLPEERRIARAHGVYDFLPAEEATAEGLPDFGSMEVCLTTDVRTLPLPGDERSSDYTTWLRKLSLQAVLRTPDHEPVVFVDARSPADLWSARWLERTLSALTAGTAQAYASRGIELTQADAERIFRLP